MANILDHKFAESDFVGKGASSLPNRPREAGMDGTAVKAVLDNIAKVMIALGKHNDLIDNLLSTTDGNSGADSIGVTAIPGVTGATTQAVLESLKTLIDATVIDQIPDNSLAEIKMANGMKKDIVGGVASYNIVSTHDAKLVTGSGGVHGLTIEEGAWTPTLMGFTTAGVHTYVRQVGQYYKIGNLVTVEGHIQLASKDSAMAGIVQIAGLPFVPKYLSQLFACGSVGFYSNLNGLTTDGLTLYAGNNNPRIDIQYNNGSIQGTVSAVHITNTTLLIFSMTYLI